MGEVKDLCHLLTQDLHYRYCAYYGAVSCVQKGSSLTIKFPSPQQLYNCIYLSAYKIDTVMIATAI